MPLFGPHAIALEENDTADMSCASTETIYTKAYELARASVFGIAYKAASTAGTVDITIVVEQGIAAPDSSGEESSDTDFVTPENISDICTNRTAETLAMQSLSPIVMPWIRFKITGAGSNNADTVVNIWLGIQEQ